MIACIAVLRNHHRCLDNKRTNERTNEPPLLVSTAGCVLAGNEPVPDEKRRNDRPTVRTNHSLSLSSFLASDSDELLSPTVGTASLSFPLSSSLSSSSSSS
mmetsp:Transcript_6560/g.14124  ORF Transcript_6560/g.14124 Transcript_6560/m.14124 type:complete len:101 (-) Transcript_6560:94-396(-)